MPGLIVQSLRKAGTRHCVMMLDEIDKLSRSAHGDPSAAMLEVLEPEQSATFRDNYLGVPFDLNCVVFVATANVMDQVPAPMRDRMEVIELPGYTQEEKLQIAQRPARFGGTVRRHRCACACTSRRDPEGRA